MTLTPSMSRALALGLLLVVLGLIFGLLVKPAFSSYRTNRERVASLQHQLGHYQRLAHRRGELEKELKALSLNQEVKDYYLSSKTDSLAVAEMQALLKRIIEKSGGRFVSGEPLSAPFGRSKIRVRMNGDILVLQKVIYAIEAGKPLILIESATIQAQRIRPSATEDFTIQLDISLGLSGFLGGIGS